MLQALALLTESVNKEDPAIRIGSIMGLGLAYAGSQNETVLTFWFLMFVGVLRMMIFVPICCSISGQKPAISCPLRSKSPPRCHCIYCTLTRSSVCWFLQ